jgi:hypothetical protein
MTRAEIEAVLHCTSRSNQHRDYAIASVLKLINKPKTTEMIKKNFCDFTLLLSDDPRQIFKYYNVQKMHGLSLTDCEAKMEQGGSYIDGWVNIAPQEHLPPFLFINLKTANEQPIWKTATLIMHEACHMAVLLENRKPKNPDDPEEYLITQAEEIANRVMEWLKFPDVKFFINTKDLWDR